MSDDIKLPPLPKPMVDIAVWLQASSDAEVARDILNYARAAVEADRQDHLADVRKMVPSNEELDDLSDEFHGYSGNHTRDGYLIPKFDYLGFARALLSRCSSQTARSGQDETRMDADSSAKNEGDFGQPAASSADYEAVMADQRRLVRELDVLLNGEDGAAPQASLCDIVAQVQREGLRSKWHERHHSQPAASAEVDAWRERFPAYEYRPQDECVSLKLSTPAASAEPVVRYCPGCGSIGPVSAGYANCCPDGNQARMIPRALAEKCHDIFMIAVKAMMAESANDPVAPVAQEPVGVRDLLHRAKWVLELVDKDQCTTICTGGLVSDISAYLAAPVAAQAQPQNERQNIHEIIPDRPSAQDQRDAERYRWLRDLNGVDGSGVEIFINDEAHGPGHLTAQIDAARAAKGQA